MNKCFFVSDLHGKTSRYEKLFKKIATDIPSAVFFGGDLLPSGFQISNVEYDDFFNDFILKNFLHLQKEMGKDYPEIYLILGNDDPKTEEVRFKEAEEKGLWKYMHMRKITIGKWNIYGYSNVPPTPFLYKDWEKYDVSRYVDPGCVPPTEGKRSVITNEDIEFASIKKDLEKLCGDDKLENAIMLFHSPPYKTNLDRAALDGKMVEHIPMDVHVGSIAIKEMIEERKPHITLHGHIHESTSITGHWKDKIGTTTAFNAATNKDELSIIIFDAEKIENAERITL